MTEVEREIYMPSTGFNSEKKSGSEMSMTVKGSDSKSSRSSKGSTILICCSDASLNDPTDLAMNVKVDVGPSRSDSAVEKVAKDVESSEKDTGVTQLQHSDPFPDDDGDDDDEDADHQVERLTWDVSEPGMEKSVEKVEGGKKSADVDGNDPPKLRDVDFGGRSAGGMAERNAGGIPKRYSVEVAERDPGRIPKRYTVEIEERTGGKVSKRYCGEIAESDAGGFPGRDAGGYPERYSGKSEDQDTSGYPERYPPKFATRDAGRLMDRDAGRYQERYPERLADNATGGYPERYPQKFATREAVGFSGRQAGGYQERYSERYEARATSGYPERYPPKIVSGDAGGYPERYLGRLEDQDNGGYPERYPTKSAKRDSGRSVIRKDPADIPKRYPGAADIDPIQTLGRYLGKIAEDDPGAMRQRILDYIADRDNRENEKRYAGEDAGDVLKKYSSGELPPTRTFFSSIAPPQNFQNDNMVGYQSGPVPPSKKKGSTNPKTFSTVSRDLDSVTETFYTFDDEGGEELRVLVDGWPKLEVTREPGSLLYEGNWVDNPETRNFGEKCKTTSVIEANGCKIRMDRRCNGQEEFIALYKDDVLICKAGRRMV